MNHKNIDHLRVNTSASVSVSFLEHYASGFPPYHKGNYTTKKISLNSNISTEKGITEKFSLAIEQSHQSNSEINVNLSSFDTTTKGVAILRAIRAYSFIKYQKQIRINTSIIVNNIDKLNYIITAIMGDIDEINIASEIDNISTEQLIDYIEKNYMKSLKTDSLAGNSETEQRTSEYIEMLLEGKL